MNNKETLKILVVDRSLKQNEHPVRDIFQVFFPEYDLIVFLFKKQNNCTEVVFSKYSLMRTLEELFSTECIYDDDDDFYDFDVKNVDEQGVYDILDQKFNVEIINLTVLENPKEKTVHDIAALGAKIGSDDVAHGRLKFSD